MLLYGLNLLLWHLLTWTPHMETQTVNGSDLSYPRFIAGTIKVEKG